MVSSQAMISGNHESVAAPRRHCAGFNGVNPNESMVPSLHYMGGCLRRQANNTFAFLIKMG